MNSRIRQADIGDALHLAAIIDIAGHGIDLDHWLKARDCDHSVLSAARRLVREDRNLPYHYSRAHVLEVDGIIAGGLFGGLVADEGRREQWLTPHLAPLVTLENRSPGYWSVGAVAIFAEFRGNGLASRLLDHASQLASQSRARGLSIVVEDSNIAAITLYRKKGFEKAEALPWIAYGGRVGPNNWVKLTKAI